MKREEVQYLNNLSLKVYGSKSRWRKMIKNGDLVDAESTNKKKEVIKVKRTSYWSVEEVKKIMEEIFEEENQKKEGETKDASIQS